MTLKRIKISIEMDKNKNIWPVIWSIVRYAITAILGYLSNGTII